MFEVDLNDGLERFWQGPGGFLYKIRNREIDLDQGERLLDFLREIPHEELSSVPRRTVSLLWYIPLVMEWQSERISSKADHALEYQRLKNSILTETERILGVP